MNTKRYVLLSDDTIPFGHQDEDSIAMSAERAVVAIQDDTSVGDFSVVAVRLMEAACLGMARPPKHASRALSRCCTENPARYRQVCGTLVDHLTLQLPPIWFHSCANDESKGQEDVQ